MPRIAHKSRLPLLAAALTLLLSANAAIADYRVRIPMGYGSACAGEACAGGGGPAPTAMAISIAPGNFVTVTNGTAPYTYTAALLAWSELYGYEGAPDWEDCTPTALNGTAFLGSWWGVDADGVVADCQPARAVDWSPALITVVPRVDETDENRLSLTPYLYYDGTAYSASPSGRGWQFQYRLTVTDATGASATTGVQTAVIDGY